MSRKITLLLSLILGALSGCATLDKKTCERGDWYPIGEQDALAGHVAAQRLAAHNKACGEHHIQVDSTTYYAGYQNGLPRYCTASNGYFAGRAGQFYKQICPAELERDFLPAYRDGQQVYEILQRINRLEADYYSVQSRMMATNDAAVRAQLQSQMWHIETQISLARLTLSLRDKPPRP